MVAQMRMLRNWRAKATPHEFVVLVALVLVLGGIWGFVELAVLINQGETRGVDVALLLALRNPADLAQPIGPAWLPDVMRDITALGGVAVLSLLTASVIGYLLLLRQYRMAALVAVAIGGAVMLNMILKLGFDRPRPDLVPHAAQIYSTSFPSGHSMVAAATYLTLAAMVARVQPTRRLKLYFLAVAILVMVLVGISRIYLGVHWPTDVLGGWTAGATWALICWSVAWWVVGRTDVRKS
jgi:undecaprenyl-diphosphatase